MDIICKRFIKGMEKANNMMTDNDMMCWHALYTAPKSEHKLMQRLNAAGYTTYCPMQAVFVKWKGPVSYTHLEEVLALVQHSYTEKKAILIGLMKKIVPIFPLSSTR